MTYKKWLMVMSLVLALASCSSSKSGFTGEIVILHTNDMHAKIGQFPRLAYMVDSIRAVRKHVMLVSAGDLFSGNVTVDQYPERGFPMVNMMNMMNYDVSALGNHEFDYGQAVLNKRMKEAKFPFLCANVENISGVLNKPDAYRVMTVPGTDVKVAFLGLLESFNNNIPSTHPKRVEGLNFPNPYETALNYKSLVDSADLFVALSHLGDKPDSVLASKMPELDVIVGGHSHVLIPGGVRVNDVLITQAHSMLKYLGELVVVFKDGKPVSITEKTIPVGKGAVNEELKKLLAEYESNPFFLKSISESKTAFDSKASLGYMMTDAYTSKEGVDIGVQNFGGVRLESLPAGNIRVKDIFSLDPFGNELVAVPMNLEDIKSLLKYASVREKKSLFASGIYYEVKRDAEGKVLDVIVFTEDKKPLSPNKIYKVGMSDYIYSAYKFTRQGDAVSTGKTTAETIIDFVTERKTMPNYNAVNRRKF